MCEWSARCNDMSMPFVLAASAAAAVTAVAATLWHTSRVIYMYLSAYLRPVNANKNGPIKLYYVLGVS